jgi:hypothetical protein
MVFQIASFLFRDIPHAISGCSQLGQNIGAINSYTAGYPGIYTCFKSIIILVFFNFSIIGINPISSTACHSCNLSWISFLLLRS